VFNLQGLLSDRITNELKIGYNSAPTRINGLAPVINGIDFGNIVLNLSGSVANTGIAGRAPIQASSFRAGSSAPTARPTGAASRATPYTVSFIDSVSTVKGNHFLKSGGDTGDPDVNRSARRHHPTRLRTCPRS
jgi:hypothetical protein